MKICNKMNLKLTHKMVSNIEKISGFKVLILVLTMIKNEYNI